MNNTFKPNAFKIEFNEEEFRVSFAENSNNDSAEPENEVVLQFEPDKIMSVIAPLFASVIKYQEQYGKDIGLKMKED